MRRSRRRGTIGVLAGSLLLALAAGEARAQLPEPQPFQVDPPSQGFGHLPVGTAVTGSFRVCKTVPDGLLGGTTIGSSIDGHILSSLSSGPFTIVGGKQLDLRERNCETVTIRFAPSQPGAFFAWLRFQATESPFRPGDRLLFRSYALLVGSGVRGLGLRYVDADVLAGSGTIRGPGMDCPPRCRSELGLGETAVFTALPGRMEGASIPYFRGWDGACAGQGNPCRLTVTGDATIHARFGAFSPPPAPFGQLVVDVTGSGRVYGPDFICTGPARCTRGYRAGTVLHLGANGRVFDLFPPVQKPFLGWSGACGGSGETCTVTIGPEVHVTAAFGDGIASPQRRGLFVTEVKGDGRVTSAGIDCPDDCGSRLPTFQDVALTARPASGWTFPGWGWGGACTGQGNPCALRMNTDKAVTATFVQVPGGGGAPAAFPPRLSVVALGGGRVEGSGVSCPPACVLDLPAGTPVALAALPAPLHRFAGWAGACAGRPNPCQLTVDRDVSAIALFFLPELPLQVFVQGGGRVSVGDQPSLQGCCSHHGGVCGCGGDHVVCCDESFSPTCSCTEINCPGDCEELYPAGTEVDLRVHPSAGWRFAGWTGACAGQADPCVLTVTAPLQTTAVFLPAGSAAAAPAFLEAFP